MVVYTFYICENMCIYIYFYFKFQNLLLLRVIDMTKSLPKCNELIKLIQKGMDVYENEPVIYIITPTYERPVQKAELTRMSHTLLLVGSILHIYYFTFNLMYLKLCGIY